MHKHGMSYKNLYKYNFIHLYESVYGSSKPKFISYRNKYIINFNTECQKVSKTQIKFNSPSKNFPSFHKSLLHLKLSINPKFKNDEKICYTERSPEKKKEIEKFKNIYKRIFLTNLDEHKKRNNLIMTPLITDYQTKLDKNYNNDKYISIPANTFLHFKKNKYLYFLPDVINEKISDFIDETKMLRNLKYINTLKKERQKRKTALLELIKDENDLEINSYKKSINLINIYKRCFGDYNKFLINEIKKEKKLLNDYNIFKNSLEDQVNILQKQFDDIINELEIVNNFKLIFTAIKNKTKIEDCAKLSKIFIEELKKKLKNKTFIPTNIQNLSYTKKKTTINKNKLSRSRRLSIGSFKENKNPTNINENDKPVDKRKIFRKTLTVVTVPKKTKRKIERLNSYQPSIELRKKNFENNLNKDNLDYDVERNERAIINNILNFVDKYNGVNENIIHLKVMLEKEENLLQNMLNNKLINNQSFELTYAKNYNKILKEKYKFLCYHNNDYSLHLAIYHKINRTISSVISFKIKKFSHLIDKFKSLYDKNILFYTYKTISDKHESRRIYFEKEIINYIYNALTLIERLQFELINKRNEYLNNNYYQEQILEYENKMDMNKKIINNREKRMKELLRKKELFEKAIEKSNKTIFKPFRKVPKVYPMKSKKALNIKDKNDENEEFLLY